MPHKTVYTLYIISIINLSSFLPCDRHGVFMSDELQDLPKLLYRLGQVHSLFTRPHPLTKLTDDEECETSGAVMTLTSFHSCFLKYLIQNRFYSFVYHYLDQYKYVQYTHLNTLCVFVKLCLH